MSEEMKCLVLRSAAAGRRYEPWAENKTTTLVFYGRPSFLAIVIILICS